MSEDDGLIWAYHVDGRGRGTPLDWADIEPGAETQRPDDGYVWIHFDLRAASAVEWIRDRSGLSELAAGALMLDETRPRSTAVGDALLMILRGVNLNPGADPEDMVSIRVWAEGKRVITIRRRRIIAASALRELVEAGRGPRNVGAFVHDLSSHLVERMAAVIGELDEQLDDVEEATTLGIDATIRGRLVELRRQAIALRRYLAPQRDALARLSTERIEWLGDTERLQLREVHDRTVRFVEDLDEARERAAVTQEQIASQLAEQLNERMYALSIVAGIFLPLSFATGLLGINVAGMPGAETSWAFDAVCAGLVVMAIGELWLFRRLGWL